MGMLKKKDEKKTTKDAPAEVPELPQFFMEIGVEAQVASRLVADKGELHRVNSLSFITPDMNDAQLQHVLEQLDACMTDAGICRVGFYPKEGASGEENKDDNQSG